MIKAKLADAPSAFLAFSRIFEETKMGQDPAWVVSRMLRHLKGHVKDFDRTQSKLYRDRGGVVVGNGVQMQAFQDRDKNESLEAFELRFKAYWENCNALADEIEALRDRDIEVDLDPISMSIFPKKRKNEKGEEEEILYRATDIANAGPFVTDVKKE
jgi:hypothetical protein